MHIWSGVDKDKRTRAGIWFLIKRKITRRIAHCEEISERLMWVDLDYLGRNIAIFGVYASRNNETPDVKGAFEKELSAALEKVCDEK